MAELEAAWQGTLIAALGLLTAVLTAVGVQAVAYINDRGKEIRERTKRGLVDDAVLAVEEKSRHGHVPDKLAEAMRLADRATPSRVVITPEDVQAGVARRRASLPMLDDDDLDTTRPPKRPMP